MDKQQFLGEVAYQDSVLFLDGGMIEGRKIILKMDLDCNSINIVPLACAQIVKD